MISWKLFWSAGGAVLTAAVAAMMVLTKVPVLVCVLVMAGLAVVFVAVANKVVHGAELFDRIKIESRIEIVRWLAAAAAVHAVWGVVFRLKPSLWMLWVGSLAGLALLEYWVARGHEYLLTRIKPTADARKAERAEMALQRDADLVVRKMRYALSLSGHDWLVIKDWEPIGVRVPPVGVRYEARVPSRMAVAGKTKDGKNAGKLDSADVEPIAIAMSEALETELATDWVHITKKPGAGAYSISVLTEDVMTQTYEYVDTPEWTSITTPALVGYDIGGEPYRMRLDQHGADVGMSRWGKSSLVNVRFAHTTRCADAVQWVCGVEKLYDLVGPWIEPYLGTDLPLPFDAIASGPQDTAEMLATVMRIARWRQQQPHHTRKGFKKIIIELDEASFALVIRNVFATYEEMKKNLSELAVMIVKGAGSGGAHLHLAAQRGTHNNWGDHGGDINAGLSWQTVFKSKDPAEIGRATGDFQLSPPRHKGEYWLEPGEDGKPVIKLKAPYMQETDPQREKLHNGATISDVAWARRNFHTELDEGSARAAGEWYRTRHTRATAALVAYLTGNYEPVPAHGSAHDEAMAQVEAEVQAMISVAGWQADPAPMTQESGGGVATMVGQQTRAERIATIVGGSTTPMSPVDILAALKDQGDTSASPQVVTNALGKLVQDGALTRRDRGEYVAN
jgi:hypothetical protein